MHFKLLVNVPANNWSVMLGRTEPLLSTLESLICIFQGHYTAIVRFEPWISFSGVRRSTTEPPHFKLIQTMAYYQKSLQILGYHHKLGRWRCNIVRRKIDGTARNRIRLRSSGLTYVRYRMFSANYFAISWQVPFLNQRPRKIFKTKCVTLLGAGINQYQHHLHPTTYVK